MEIIKTSQPLNDTARNKLLYNANVIIFEQLPAILEINAYLDRLVLNIFRDLPKDFIFDEPDNKQHNSTFNIKIGELQKHFSEDSRFSVLFRLALKQTGMDIECNYADSLFLRCVPPLLKNNLYRGKISHHRDTWGSNIQQQINWWSSLCPVTEENTLVFYPEYWEKPIENSTSEWSYSAFCEARAFAKRHGISHIDYPYAPEATQTIFCGNPVSIISNPGDLVCFSSAHLHASTEKPRGYCRFSIELRTFAEADAYLNIPPENVDNANFEPRYDWFKRLSDKEKYYIKQI